MPVIDIGQRTVGPYHCVGACASDEVESKRGGLPLTDKGAAAEGGGVGATRRTSRIKTIPCDRPAFGGG